MPYACPKCWARYPTVVEAEGCDCAYELSVEGLRKRATCCAFVEPESAGDDLATALRWAADQIEALHKDIYEYQRTLSDREEHDEKAKGGA